MFKSTLLFAKLAVLATAVVLMTAGESQAQRFGGGRGGFGGGRGGYGGYGGYGGGFGVYGVYGGYGGYGYQPYYSGYGSYGYSPYNVYGSTPYYYSESWVPYQGYSPVTPATTTYQSYYPPQSDQTNNTAMVEVTCPPNAQLWFDNTATAQTGTNRHFATPPLSPGQTYTYEIRATWTQPDGTPMTK
jgi:uncharacterized protein (TIGR03000 family)